MAHSALWFRRIGTYRLFLLAHNKRHDDFMNETPLGSVRAKLVGPREDLLQHDFVALFHELHKRLDAQRIIQVNGEHVISVRERNKPGKLPLSAQALDRAE